VLGEWLAGAREAAASQPGVQRIQQRARTLRTCVDPEPDLPAGERVGSGVYLRASGPARQLLYVPPRSTSHDVTVHRIADIGPVRNVTWGTATVRPAKISRRCTSW
jgi:hypothetical protein